MRKLRDLSSVYRALTGSVARRAFDAGPLRWVKNKINDLMLHARNAEALRRLAELAENSRRPGSVPR